MFTNWFVQFCFVFFVKLNFNMTKNDSNIQSRVQAFKTQMCQFYWDHNTPVISI